MLFVQSEGYSKAEDSLLKVIVDGNLEEAKTFDTTGQKEETQQDEETESEQSGTKKKKRRKSMKPSPEDESTPPCRVSFPLTVSLKITTKCVGSVTICFYYLPFFNAVCSSVTSIDLETDHASLKDIFVDKSFLLHNLFEGDSGKFSPNSAVSVQIRKYGGTNFSAAVRQYGFPFKWVQQVCGITVLSDAGVEFSDIKLDNEVSSSSLVDVVTNVRDRMISQLNLSKQLLSLEQLKIPDVPPEDDKDEDNPKRPSLSVLSRWKSLSLSEVQSSQFGGLSIFNIQERANRYFLATFSQETARWHSIICVSPEYPRVKPVLIVLVELTEKQREPYNLQLKNIEADVNIHYPLTLKPDPFGENLLSLQLLRLQVLVENYIQIRTGSSSLKDLSLSTRGKGRLITALELIYS
ncbi:PREDICTED: THO complex subunit 5 homolog A-like [Amphimedon queenslandica]|uniref:Uncharacterized protein n=1 Tax=Amphimedon queenslandica TaxID=400682 RepID=A0A1X7V2C1_AMPQE|nr:PREDICTED: THO complex subunit 5 homolog A-like [Amphimedon queenslandica]|eukprot:XP_019850905.1 PREDICTED: THO complex subunit 5 homolog A-like [Amphimedon queenslandica]